MSDQDPTATSSVDTPGCDCGHNGMGRGWHLDGCHWLEETTEPRTRPPFPCPRCAAPPTEPHRHGCYFGDGDETTDLPPWKDLSLLPELGQYLPTCCIQCGHGVHFDGRLWGVTNPHYYGDTPGHGDPLCEGAASKNGYTKPASKRGPHRPAFWVRPNTALGMPLHKPLPDGWQAVGLVAVVRAIDKDGQRRMTTVGAGDVMLWEAAGMLHVAQRDIDQDIDDLAPVAPGTPQEDDSE